MRATPAVAWGTKTCTSPSPSGRQNSPTRSVRSTRKRPDVSSRSSVVCRAALGLAPGGAVGVDRPVPRWDRRRAPDRPAAPSGYPASIGPSTGGPRTRPVPSAMPFSIGPCSTSGRSRSGCSSIGCLLDLGRRRSRPWRPDRRPRASIAPGQAGGTGGTGGTGGGGGGGPRAGTTATARRRCRRPGGPRGSGSPSRRWPLSVGRAISKSPWPLWAEMAWAWYSSTTRANSGSA